MAKTTTWTAAVDRDWAEPGNWDDGVPASGDTVRIAGPDSEDTYPTSNRPTAGTFHFECWHASGTVDLTYVEGRWLDTGATYGDIDAAFGVTIPPEVWTGAATVGGTLYIYLPLHAGNVVFAGGTLRFYESGAAELDGAVSGAGGTCDWGSGGSIVGSFNATNITHANNGALEIDAASQLELGGDATSVAVTPTAATAILTNQSIKSLSTSGAGSVASLADTVVEVAGNIALAAGTNTGFTGTIRQTANGGTVAIPALQRIGGTLHLASAAGVTSTTAGIVAMGRLKTGAGTVATSAGHNLWVYPAADDPLDLDDATTWSGTALVYLISSAAARAQKAFRCGLAGVWWLPAGSLKLTATGRWTLTGSLGCWTSTNGVRGEVDLGAHGLTANEIIIGSTDAVDRRGDVDLGSGMVVIGSGGIRGGNAANAANNVLDFGSAVVELAGVLNGALIGAFANTSAVVVGGTVNNVDLTGQAELLHLAAAGASGNVNVLSIAGLPGGELSCSPSAAA